MLKTSIRALVVVTAFAFPCISYGATSAYAVSAHQASVSQLGPGDPVPDPVFKKKSSSNFGPGDPVPDPVFKKKSSSN